MKIMLSGLLALFFALPAAAQTEGEISAEIAATGLAATEARLAGLSAPSPDETLALGALQFLRAVERTLQTRWQSGMSASFMGLPVLRLPVSPNPEAKFDAAVVNRLFDDLLADLDRARETLDAVDAGSEASLRLDLGDVWFDVNDNGVREPEEGLANIAAGVLMLRPDLTLPAVRFDVADAAWASAYTHLLSAVAEVVLAFDPAPQVARVAAASRAMRDLGAPSPFANAIDMQFGGEIDLAASIYFSLQTQPDGARTRAARQHLLDMVAANRAFWNRVASETDNDAEWIPNDRQISAIGLEFPEGLAARWMAVLDDAEALLRGEKLIPFWRMRTGAGINLRRLMDDPPPVDIAEWLHGAGLLPFAEAGERVSPENWALFERLVGGESVLFVFVLN